MSISQISPNSLTTNSPYANPSAKTTETQAGAIQQGGQDALKPSKAAQTDTVTISQQALQMTPSVDSKADGAKSSTNNNLSSNQNPNSKQPGSFSAQG